MRSSYFSLQPHQTDGRIVATQPVAHSPTRSHVCFLKRPWARNPPYALQSIDSSIGTDRLPPDQGTTLWSRRTEVVAVLKTELKKRGRHHRTNDVRTDIRVFGATTAVPQKTRQRIKEQGPAAPRIHYGLAVGSFEFRHKKSLPILINLSYALRTSATPMTAITSPSQPISVKVSSNKNPGNECGYRGREIKQTRHINGTAVAD